MRAVESARHEVSDDVRLAYGPACRGCEASRSISARALAGSTSAEVVLHQVHPGAYKLNAVLDRDDNIQSQVFPSSGDGVALPDQAVTVSPSGESTAQSAIAVTVP